VSRFAVLVLGVLAAAVCTRLGFWQLDRLGQRRALNVRIAARLAEPPVDLTALATSAGPAGEDLDYRRIRVAGLFDFEREVIVVARTLRGVPGVHVVTPLLLPDGDAVLVERGWAPSPDSRSVDLAGLREPPDADVTGVLLVSRGGGATAAEGWPVRVRAVDPGSLAPRYPYRLLPLLVRRGESAGAPFPPVPLPELTAGPHLSYAVQWFAFGVIALVGSVVLARSPSVNAGDARR